MATRLANLFRRMIQNKLWPNQGWRLVHAGRGTSGNGINNLLILSTRLVEFVDSLAFEQEILIDEFHVSVVCLAVDAGSTAS